MVLVLVRAREGTLTYRVKVAWTYFRISIVWGATLTFLGLYSIISALPRGIYRFFRPPKSLDINSLNFPSVPNSRMN